MPFPVFYGILRAMFGLSGGHLLIIAIIVLLFGNRRLPELGSALGKGINAFKKGMEGESLSDTPNGEVAHQDSKKINDQRMT